MADDNSHYQDLEERWEQGTYDTVDEALTVCCELVEQSRKGEYRPGIAADALYDRYMSFGDDPFIVVIEGTDESAKFSARSYANERCRVICAKS
jgi:hypothetical protein